jgi:hypothetical protein
MKTQTEHINIHNFHLISEMFTIYLPFFIARRLALNLCNYESEYKLTNCTHALEESKHITEIFKYLKLDYIYDDPSKYRINYILCKVKYCLKNKFKQNWTDNLNDDKRVNPNSKNKLRTYRKFKSIFKLEPYLLFETKQHRKLLTKFRISAHNLNIEKGRYIGTKVEDRICNLCKNNIEDEVHFLITSPLLEKFREPYIKNIRDI